MNDGCTPAYRATRRPDIFFWGSGPTSALSSSRLLSFIQVPFGQRFMSVPIQSLVVGAYPSSAMGKSVAYR